MVVAWKRVEPTIVTKIDYHNVVVKTFMTPNNKLVTRAIFQNDGTASAGVIAITKDNKIVVARQFRPGPEKIMDEIPGGFMDGNEEPESAARRELMEETGYEPGEMIFLGVFSAGSYSNARHYCYLALECVRRNEQTLDDNEFVDIKLCSIQEFIDNAKSGGMSDPYAVLAAYDKLKEIQHKETLK